MNVIRKIQLLILLATAGVGTLALLQAHRNPLFTSFDAYLSSSEPGSITHGSIVRDPDAETPRERKIRKVSAPAKTNPDYLVCRIDDDPDNINAFGIYHPADLAITLDDLRQKNVQSIYLTTHLRWPDLEIEERATLTTSLEKFKYNTIATPVRRDPSATSPPNYIHRSSLPSEFLGSSADLLPRVNALSLPPDIEIPPNTLTGFSSIETAATSPDTIPLLARWSDRIIFNANLLEYLQHLGLGLKDITITPGQAIRLGTRGNMIPIDDFGQFRPEPIGNLVPPTTIKATHTGEMPDTPLTHKSAILTAEGQKASKFAAIANPYQTLAQIARTPTLSSPISHYQFPLWVELLTIIAIALLAAYLLPFRSAPRHGIFLLVLITLPATILLISHKTTHFSFPSVYLITIFTAYILTTLLARFLPGNHPEPAITPHQKHTPIDSETIPDLESPTDTPPAAEPHPQLPKTKKRTSRNRKPHR